MTRKSVAVLALAPSVLLYGYQLALFTTDQELLLYGLFGLSWFGLLVSSPSTSALLLGAVSAFGLGFVPHRLRLGDGFDLFVALVPLTHFASTYCAARLMRTSMGRHE